jgi:predicted DNA-binding transcriptional regulator YafY
MPTPINPHISYGQKLISLFARLLFSKKEYSLIDLSSILDCSKQTVMRLIEDIQLSYGVEIEDYIKERKKYYRLKQVVGTEPILQLSHSELTTLQMCMSFTEHLLGDKLFTEATKALEKNQLLLTANQGSATDCFANFHAGRIDYTPHQDTLRTVIDALEKRQVCEITYQRPMADEARIFSIEPIKIFSHLDTIYLHARLQRDSEKHYSLFAIHRIKNVTINDTTYEIPEDYNFEQFFNQNFGVMKYDAFPVTIEFTDFAAAFVAERTWNSETRKEWMDNDTLILSFEVSSKPELIGWVLSWGGRAKVLEPDWLATEINQIIFDMAEEVKANEHPDD